MALNLYAILYRDYMENFSDQQLINNYLAGDKQSLEILVKRYLKPVYGFLYRYLNNNQDAEDITQEVFVKAWRHLKEFNPQKKFKTWILSIAKNAAIDFLRKRKVAVFSEFENENGENALMESLVDPSPLPDKFLEQKDLSQTLGQIIKKLPPQYQIILYLRYNDHFTFKEIAESLEEPLNTVKSRHRRALLMLKKRLAISG